MTTRTIALSTAMLIAVVSLPIATSAQPVRPADDWIAARVAEAQSRLSVTEGGQRALACIEAHGGLTRWYANGPIEFRFTYDPEGDRPPTDTVQLIDTWRSIARHWLPDRRDIGFGWDGEHAWTVGESESLPRNTRFWALTPYYFVAIPWVMADPGVNLALEGEIEFEGRRYDQVRMTFEPGTGDAPDDFYVVYIDRETNRVGGLRYIVSYPGFFPDGGHSNEKFMSYDGAAEVDGIVLPESYRTFAWDQGATGELVTRTTLSEVVFRPEATMQDLAPPAGATMSEGL